MENSHEREETPRTAEETPPVLKQEPVERMEAKSIPVAPAQGPPHEREIFRQNREAMKMLAEECGMEFAIHASRQYCVHPEEKWCTQRGNNILDLSYEALEQFREDGTICQGAYLMAVSRGKESQTAKLEKLQQQVNGLASLKSKERLFKSTMLLSQLGSDITSFETWDTQLVYTIMGLLKDIVTGLVEGYLRGEIMAHTLVLITQIMVYRKSRDRAVKALAALTILTSSATIAVGIWNSCKADGWAEVSNLVCGSILKRFSQRQDNMFVPTAYGSEDFEPTAAIEEARSWMRFIFAILMTMMTGVDTQKGVTRFFTQIKTVKEADTMICELAQSMGLDLTSKTGTAILIETKMREGQEFLETHNSSYTIELYTRLKAWQEAVNKMLSNPHLGSKTSPLASLAGKVTEKGISALEHIRENKAGPIPTGIFWYGPRGTGKTTAMMDLHNHLAARLGLSRAQSGAYDLKAGGAYYMPLTQQVGAYYDELNQNTGKSSNTKVTDFLNIISGCPTVLPTAQLEGKTQKPSFLWLQATANDPMNLIGLELRPNAREAMFSRFIHIEVRFRDEADTRRARTDIPRYLDYRNMIFLVNDVEKTFGEIKELVESAIRTQMRQHLERMTERAQGPQVQAAPMMTPVELERVLKGEPLELEMPDFNHIEVPPPPVFDDDENPDQAEMDRIRQLAEERYKNISKEKSKKRKLNQRRKRSSQPEPSTSTTPPQEDFEGGESTANIELGKRLDHEMNGILKEEDLAKQFQSNRRQFAEIPLTLGFLMALYSWMIGLAFILACYSWGFYWQYETETNAAVMIAKNWILKRVTQKNRNSQGGIQDQPPQGNRIIYLYGKPGVGKTYSSQEALQKLGYKFHVLTREEYERGARIEAKWILIDDLFGTSLKDQETHIRFVNRQHQKNVVILTNIKPWSLGWSEERSTYAGWWRRSGWTTSAYSLQKEVNITDTSAFLVLFSRINGMKSDLKAIGKPVVLPRYDVDVRVKGEEVKKSATPAGVAAVSANMDCVQGVFNLSDFSPRMVEMCLMTLAERGVKISVRIAIEDQVFYLQDGSVYVDNEKSVMAPSLEEDFVLTNPHNQFVYDSVEVREILSGKGKDQQKTDIFMAFFLDEQERETDWPARLVQYAKIDPNEYEQVSDFIDWQVAEQQSRWRKWYYYGLAGIAIAQLCFHLFSAAEEEEEDFEETKRGKNKGRGRGATRQHAQKPIPKGSWIEGYSEVIEEMSGMTRKQAQRVFADYYGYNNYGTFVDEQPQYVSTFEQVYEYTNAPPAYSERTRVPEKTVDKNVGRVVDKDGRPIGMGLLITSQVGVSANHVLESTSPAFLECNGAKRHIVMKERVGSSDTSLFLLAGEVPGVVDLTGRIMSGIEGDRAEVGGPLLTCDGIPTWNPSQLSKLSGQMTVKDKEIFHGQVLVIKTAGAHLPSPGTSGSPWIGELTGGEWRILGVQSGIKRAGRQAICSMITSEQFCLTLGKIRRNLRKEREITPTIAKTPSLPNLLVKRMVKPDEDGLELGEKWKKIGKVPKLPESHSQTFERVLGSEVFGYANVHAPAHSIETADLNDVRYQAGNGEDFTYLLPG